MIKLVHGFAIFASFYMNIETDTVIDLFVEKYKYLKFPVSRGDFFMFEDNDTKNEETFFTVQDLSDELSPFIVSKTIIPSLVNNILYECNDTPYILSNEPLIGTLAETVFHYEIHKSFPDYYSSFKRIGMYKDAEELIGTEKYKRIFNRVEREKNMLIMCKMVKSAELGDGTMQKSVNTILSKRVEKQGEESDDFANDLAFDVNKL